MRIPIGLISPRTIVKITLLVILIPILPILISWRWDWTEGWIVAAIFI